MTQKIDPVADAFETVEQNLATMRGCIEAIEDALDKSGNLDLLTELREAQKNHELYLTQLKHQIVESGNDRITLGEHEVTVSHPKSLIVSDPESFVATARRNGDLDDLFRAGVVQYNIDAKQIDRLEPAKKVRYKEFISEKELAVRVNIPAGLNGPSMGL